MKKNTTPNPQGSLQPPHDTAKENEILEIIKRGNALRRQDDNHASLAAFEQALQLARETQNHTLLAEALIGKGDALRMLNRHDEALTAFEEALTESRACGNRQTAANALKGKGEALRMLRSYEEARSAFEEALTESRACGDRQTVASALRGKGHALRRLNLHDEALSTFEEALTESRACGNRQTAANALRGKGLVLGMLNRCDEALSAFEEALTESRACGNRQTVANVLIDIGEALELQGNLERSAEVFKEANLLGLEFGYGHVITRGQAGLRRLAEVEKHAAPRPKNSDKLSQPPSDTHHIPLQADGKADDQAVFLLERRVISIFGPHTIIGLPTEISARERQLKSMLPDERVWAVTLMCDIRGYTTSMASADPEDQLSILNDFLICGTQLIQECGGGVDKYMGDAILGFFLPINEKSPSEEDKAKTVKAAIASAINIANNDELKRKFEKFKMCCINPKAETFGIGVGLAAGWAKFGEIGASWRCEYTMIGKPVNLVSRVQGVAKAWEVLGTQDCWNELPHPDDEKFSAFWPCDRGEMPIMKGYEDVSLVVISRKQ